MRTSAEGGDTSVVTSLSIAGGASPLGRWDLQDNKLIVRSGNLGSWSGSAYTGITGLVQSGQNGGAWNGNGIFTSRPDALTLLTTLAVATSDAAGYAGGIFGGISVNSGDVLVMYTYTGDANLDGKIDPDDFANISFNDNIAGATGYYNGDFNYDGDINADDHALITFNFNAQGAPFPTSAVELAMVPEAGGVGFMMLAVTFAAARRRRAGGGIP
jgi:hypothetical protein